MANARAPRPAVAEDGPDAGERWETGRGDGGSLYLAGDPKRRRQVADFSLGGKVPSGCAHGRALIAAQAPLMYEALLDLVSGMRQDGAIVAPNGQPFEGHRAGCECGVCQSVLALALAEGGGRCILCGCTQDDACAGTLGEGCAWEPLPSGEQFLCTAHPKKAIGEAKRFLAKVSR